MSIVRYLVGEKGWNIDITNHKAPPVHYACQLGHVDIVRYLVEKGCNLDIKADRGMTPLHAACFSGKLNVVRYLIGEKKCDIESKGGKQCTPLYYACEAGQISIVRYLVEQGCDPNARADTGATPLHHACAHGHLNVVQYLIEEQICDPWLQNKINETPMQLAIAKGQIDILKYFVKKFGVSEHTYYLSSSFTSTLVSKISKTIEVSALHVACTHGHLPVVKYLVEQLKLDPGQKCCIECGIATTPLSSACSTGRLDIVQYLLLHTVAYRYRKLTNELGGACYGCHPNVVEYFIHNRNIDPNYEDDYFKHSPLQLAISGGSEKSEKEENSQIASKALEVMEILVSSGIKLNDRNYLGDTALHTACKLEQSAFVQFLLSKNCDPTILNKANKTPLWTANTPDVIKEFMQYTPTEVCERILSDDIEENESLKLLKYLIEEHKWDPSEKTSNEDTALHLACKSDKAIIVKYLFSLRGVKYDPLAKNRHDMTPFMLTSSINIIKELIKQSHDHVGCPIFLLTNPLVDEEEVLKLVKETKKVTLKSTTDNNGNTALHLACLTDRATVVTYLLKEIHVDVNAKNESDTVRIQLTKKSEIIRELIQHGANPVDLYNHCRKVLRENKILQTAVKVCVLGDSNSGKSTLIASLNRGEWLNLSQNTSTLKSSVGSGVILHDFNSKFCGRGIVYDFVGDKLFHEKHSKLLTGISSAPQVFVVVINLADTDRNIISNLQYWLKFIEYMPSSNHTIVVGSNLDLCSDIDETMSILRERVDVLSEVKCRDFISLNCHDHSSSNMNKLKRSLVRICNIARYPNALAFNAHCFQVYIVDQFKGHEVAKFYDILKKIEEDEKHVQENDPLFFLPQTKFQSRKLCEELHYKSQVVFLQDQDPHNIESSWIVIDKSPLVSNLLRIILRKDLYQIPSNNGVLHRSFFKHSF